MSAATDDLRARLQTVEEHLAHRDIAITDLDAMVQAQGRQIDQLERQIKHLAHQLAQLKDGDVDITEAR